MSDNTIATARNIGTLGAITRTFYDFVGSTDTSDYYRFNISGSSNLRLALSRLSADADVELRAADGTRVLRKSTRAGSQDESIDFDNLAAGTYYVRVYQGTGTANTNYKLDLSAQAVAPPVISDNTPATARNIGTLGAATLTFNDFVGRSDSSDYYRFNIDGTRNLRLALSGLSANADLELRASNGTSVLRSSVLGGSQSEAINFDNLAAGTYYVRVYQGTSADNTNYQLALSAQQAVALPVISINALNATRAEGNSGSTPFTFTVSRSNGTGSSTVFYSVSGAADGSYSAASANDFINGTLPGGKLIFAAGQTSQTLTINVAGDTVVENNERFNVTLSSPTNATLGTTSAVGYINDDDVQAKAGLTASQSSLISALKSGFDSSLTRIAFNANANAYDANTKYNGQCVVFVQHARPELPGSWGPAKDGPAVVADKKFHVDVIPVIGSAFVFDANTHGAYGSGHTGIVTNVDVKRVVQNGNLTYQYQIDSREANWQNFRSVIPQGTERITNESRTFAFPKEAGLSFIWDTNADYDQDKSKIQGIIGQLYDQQLLNQSESKAAYQADAKLINRFFMLNTPAKYSNFLNLIELYKVELGAAPSLSQLSSWNLTNDVLAGAKVGDSANNSLSGGAGDDVLIGGAGNDTLTGGGGADVFKFVSTSGGVDSITDFTSGTDKIEIVSQNFGNLALGTLAATRFKYNAQPTTNDAVFLYDGTSGVLSFDRDGIGSAAAIPIATLTGAKKLYASDIQIVSA